LEPINKLFLKDDTLSLKEIISIISDWLSFFYSKRRIIILVVLAGGFLGFFYAKMKRPLYTAQMTFALEEEKGGSGLGGYAGIASQLGIDFGGGGGGAFAGENLLELIKSRLIVEKALLSPVVINTQKQSLADYYVECNGFRRAWRNSSIKDISFPYNGRSTKLSLQHDSVLSLFYNHLLKNSLIVGKVDKKLSIIAVKVSHSDELFAKCFTEALVSEVSRFYVNTKTKKSAENLAILQHQTDSVRRELNLAIGGVATSIDLNPNLNPARQILRVSSQRRQVDVQANTAILTELVKNLELAKVSLRKETPLIQIIDMPLLPLRKEKISEWMGAVIGALTFGFFTMIFLILKRVIRTSLNNSISLNRH
jgi:hypothetical protein